MFVVDLTALIIGRSIKGVGLGMLSACVGVYIVEMLPTQKRGFGTSSIQWCLTWGIMIMFYISYLCLNIEEDGSFRTAWAIESSPGFLLLLLSFLLPESPKWYASKGNWREASFTMMNMKLAWEGNLEQPNFEERLDAAGSLRNLASLEGVINLFEDNLKRCSFTDFLRPDLRYHILAGVFTQCVVQLSGIGVLMYYLVFICEMIGLQGERKILSASVQYVLNVIFTIIPILLLDKMRRKDVLVYGAASLGFCITAVGVIMGVYGREIPPVDGNSSVVWEITGTPGNVCLALCFLFVSIFAGSLSCVAWLYTNEILPSRAKAKGSAICMAVSWFLSFLLVFLAPLMLSTIMWGTFLVFGFFCFSGAICMVFFFPETFGLNEKQIQTIFGTAKESELEEGSDGVEMEDHEVKLMGSAGPKAITSCTTPGITQSRRNSTSPPTCPSLSLAPASRLTPPTELKRAGITMLDGTEPSPFLKNFQFEGTIMPGARQSDNIESRISVTPPFTPVAGAAFSDPIPEKLQATSAGEERTPDGYYSLGTAGSGFLNEYDQSANISNN